MLAYSVTIKPFKLNIEGAKFSIIIFIILFYQQAFHIFRLTSYIFIAKQLYCF